MARGKQSNDGDTNVSANGYHYTRDKGKWRLTHHLVAEKKYGRPIGENERVIFKDGKRTNLKPDNIEIQEQGRGSLRRRKAQLQARVDELVAQIEEIDRELLGTFGEKV